MKKKCLRFCSLIFALVVMTVTLTACGAENPFLGAWDDDDSQISFIFNEDGTGAQMDYNSTIDFTYTWEKDAATITANDYDLTIEVYIEDGELVMDNLSCVKVDEPSYTQENSPSGGGSEAMLNGSYTNSAGTVTISFDGAGSFGFSNNELGMAGAGTYTYDGMTLVVTVYEDSGEVSYEGTVREDDYAVYIDLWGESDIYYSE